MENDILTFKLPKKIDYTFTSCYEILLLESKNGSFEILDLDFSNTLFITLPGAIYLVFIVHAVVESKKKQNNYFETAITNYSEKTLAMLSNFGSIEMLKLYGNLKVAKDVEDHSISRVKYWKSLNNLSPKTQSIYWPMSNIPLKLGDRYEQNVRSFYGNFIDYFKVILNAGLINSDYLKTVDFIEKYFNKSINEATKNIWDHSESWGMASIQSTEYTKTTLCLFDFGVGFINSYVKRKGLYNRDLKSDMEVLVWLFQEGNTSQSSGNHGHGLSIIQKFIDMTNGTLLISTDSYLLTYTKKRGLVINQKGYFPGSQIMINF